MLVCALVLQQWFLEQLNSDDSHEEQVLLHLLHHVFYQPPEYQKAEPARWVSIHDFVRLTAAAFPWLVHAGAFDLCPICDFSKI